MTFGSWKKKKAPPPHESKQPTAIVHAKRRNVQHGTYTNNSGGVKDKGCNMQYTSSHTFAEKRKGGEEKKKNVNGQNRGSQPRPQYRAAQGSVFDFFPFSWKILTNSNENKCF